MTRLTEKQIIEKIQRGDLKRVAEITGIPASYCKVLVRRPRAKRYKEVIETLSKVIEARERLVNELKKNNL